MDWWGILMIVILKFIDIFDICYSVPLRQAKGNYEHLGT